MCLRIGNSGEPQDQPQKLTACWTSLTRLGFSRVTDVAALDRRARGSYVLVVALDAPGSAQAGDCASLRNEAIPRPLRANGSAPRSRNRRRRRLSSASARSAIASLRWDSTAILARRLADSGAGWLATYGPPSGSIGTSITCWRSAGWLKSGSSSRPIASSASSRRAWSSSPAPADRSRASAPPIAAAPATSSTWPVRVRLASTWPRIDASEHRSSCRSPQA